MIRFVTQVFNLRQLFGPHLHSDLLEHLATGYLVRQRCNHNIAILDFVRRPQAQRATAGFINLFDVITR